jgi:GAF domain-containing protein
MKTRVRKANKIARRKDPVVSAANRQRQFNQQTRELAQGRKHLAEALEQQAATSEILKVIRSSPNNVQPVFDTIAANAVRLCGARMGAVHLFDGELIDIVAFHNFPSEAVEVLRQMYPRRPQLDQASGRAILTRAVVQIEDMPADLQYTREVTVAGRWRSVLAVPMFRDDAPVGAIVITRSEAGRFAAGHIELLKTFADQAVIAIENTRLLNELRESLQQQTATADVLKVISRSTFNLHTVLDTLVESAHRLCEADKAFIFYHDGETYRWGAGFGLSPEYKEFMQRALPQLAPGRGSLAGRVALERKTVQIQDVFEDAEFTWFEAQKFGKHRTVLGVPLMREGTFIGLLGLTRNVVRPFSQRQIEVLTTFADQAVIAIENVRLFEQVQARTRELSEALDQVKATSEVLHVVSSSPADLQTALGAIAESAARLLDVSDADIMRLEADGLRLIAKHGPSRQWPVGSIRQINRNWVTGRAVIDRITLHVRDLQGADSDFPEGATFARSYGHRTTLATPLLRQGEPIGAILIRRMEVRPFTEKQIALLKTFADQAVIAIENARLFDEVQSRNDELRLALEQQTATSELLKVIGRSTVDLQPVFHTLAENAIRLCGADHALIFRFDGQVLQVVAAYNISAELRAFHAQNPIAPGRDSCVGRMALERRTIHIHDVRADPEYRYGGQEVDPYRTLLAVPIQRAGELLGAINIVRHEVLPFTDKQIALMEIFADQAVIAIENTRLFDEVQARTRDLSESLQQQTATAEVLKTISRSAFDLQSVLNALADSAVRLCEAYDCAIWRPEGDVLRPVAHKGPIVIDSVELVRSTVAGRSILEARTIHIADLQEEVDEFPEGSAIARRWGFRTLLLVPLMREGSAIGVIGLRRRKKQLFTERQIALLETFADQAVIAIANARLFEDVQARTRELSQSIGELRALGEVTQAVNSSVDLQTVLSTICAKATQLSNTEAGAIMCLMSLARNSAYVRPMGWMMR